MAIITVLVFGLALSAVLLFALASQPAARAPASRPRRPPHAHRAALLSQSASLDHREPSGLGPPLPTALTGYHRVYTTDFSGDDAAAGLDGRSPAYPVVTTRRTSPPTTSSCTAGRCGSSRPAASGTVASGGLCQCGRPMAYGAFFVRSKITDAGPNEVELLWPANNQWPPEIDFNESGRAWAATSGTVHFGASAAQRPVHPAELRVASTCAAGTPGASCGRRPRSPTRVDGHQWGTTLRTPGTIPHLPMTLDLQQRPGCVRRRGVPGPAPVDVRRLGRGVLARLVARRRRVQVRRRARSK